MKKLAVIALAILLLVASCFLIWYHTPTKFLKAIEPSEIAVIHVGSGHTGNRFDVQDSEDIAYITENIQSRTFRKGKYNRFTVGFWYSLSFCDAQGNQLGSLTVNSDLAVDSGSFDYHPDSSLNITDYLQALEEAAISGK